MADETRRSGRATKGQHTKKNEETEVAAKQKGKAKGKKGKAAPEPEPNEDEEEEEEEGSEVIRCVCGMYEEEEDNPRAMICCDKCEAWQHNSCMGLPEEWPDNKKYYCEVCRPADHKELLAAMRRGEKPWVMARQRLLQARAEEAAKKKKGKKGGRKSNNRASEAQRTPTAEPEEPVASKKRKAEESPAPEADVKPKKVRSSLKEHANGPETTAEPEETHESPEEPVQQNPALVDVANDPRQIGDSARTKIATNIVKIFVEHAINQVKSGTVTLTKGETAEALGTQIAMQIEHAVYYYKCGGTGETGDPYRTQMRAILNNVKSNADLAVRLMSKRLGADELASMDPKDMATEEQKQKDAEEQVRLEKQHVLVEEKPAGPRIRKTHKGDEYVDDSGQPTESVTSKPLPRQATIDHDTDMKSPTATSKPNVMRKPSASTKGRPFGDARRKSSANFDIDKVWSGVQGSPTEAEAPKLMENSRHGSPPPLQNDADADPEVDRLLKDEDNESQPYSPKEFSDPDIVWRGRVAGGSLGTFSTTAKFAAGCHPDVDNLGMTWEQLIPDEIKLHGRIQPSKADEYLCGLEYSNTTELIIINLAAPSDDEGRQQFEKFFNYLKAKERYGVGSQHSMPAIKDIYLLPMEVGQPLPSVMKALEHNFTDPIVERSFLVPIVVKWTELPHNAERAKNFHQAQAQHAAQSPSVQPPMIQAQTPMTPNDPHMMAFEPPRQPLFPQATSNQTTVSTNGGGIGGAPGAHATPPPGQPSQQGTVTHNLVQQLTPAPSVQQNLPAAAINAHRILGPQMSLLPAVVDLIAQAPNAGENEMRIIKECVEENAEAGQSLGVLTQMLQRKYQAKKSGEKNQAMTSQSQPQTRPQDSDVPAPVPAAVTDNVTPS